MTIYADPEFYLKEYLSGKDAVLPAQSAIFWLRKAQKTLKTFTFDNIDESAAIPYEVKMCICEIAELLYGDEKRATLQGGVVSESVEGWSKHYESSQQTEAHLQSKIKSCVRTWLADTGLLYCGVTV